MNQQMNSAKYDIRKSILVISLIVLGLGVFFLPPFKQVETYHSFVDTRTVLGIPNFWNVISNLPFLFVAYLWFKKFFDSRLSVNSQAALIAFFMGVFFTAFGSAWYHLNPSNWSLVFDRLPMTFGFMGMLGYVIGDRLSRSLEMRLLPSLLIYGVYSVFYWHNTGNLNPYILVQAGGILLLIPLSFLPSTRFANKFLYGAMSWYVLAKVFEYYDSAIFESTHELMSGHTLKHFAAAIAAWVVYRSGNAVKSSGN